MDLILLLARLLLAGVFLVAGVAKVFDRQGSIQAMRDFGVPSRLAAPSGIALPIAELAVAVALIPVVSARWGAVGALLLLLAFAGGIAINLARGKQPDCHCFGQLHSEPAGWTTLIRNGALAAVAVFMLVAGWDDPGSSAVAWIDDLSVVEGVLLAAVLLSLALLAIEGRLLSQLLQQNGRLLLRLEALEEAVDRGTPGTPAASRTTGPPGGLRVGTPGPGFSLGNLAGEATTLPDLQVAGKPTMLLFSDPGCSPCNTLMPEIGRWQAKLADTLTVVVVSRGDPEANRSKAAEHGIRNVLLQEDIEVAAAYGSPGTPSAVLLRPDGVIASPFAAGADAIRRLIDTLAPAPVSTESS